MQTTDRSGWLPVVLVAVAMLYAALVPTLLRREPDRLRSEIEGVIEPARRLARTRQASLAVEVSAYRAYVISQDPNLLDRVRVARLRSADLGVHLSALAGRVDPETAEAAAALDRRIREWHNTAEPRAEVDMRAYRPSLPVLQARFEATQDAAEALEAVLVRKTEERARTAGRLILYHDLGNVALSILAVAAVLAVTRLARREQRARARAESAVRSRDQVVSIVSHDLRSPLATVSMAATYLLDMPPTEEGRAKARHFLEMIKRGTVRMDRMIDDLLDVARIEAGGLAIERAKVTVESLMEEVATMLRPDVEKRGQRLDCRLAAGLPAVCADRGRLLQVFSNLVGNAVKFTAEGGTITVAAEAEQRAVRFSVSDTGSGIAPENIPHLFDRFWQASRSDRRGIGLGLSIVKALVEAHGGHLAVDSVPGRGTTFAFSIPLAAPTVTHRSEEDRVARKTARRTAPTRPVHERVEVTS
jgi:signal transduction histidine kinase